ncbi:MAG: site-specific integrase [Bacteroidales bacterium]|nr:site-specific integrase [Bacteroidales bacterium]
MRKLKSLPGGRSDDAPVEHYNVLTDAQLQAMIQSTVAQTVRQMTFDNLKAEPTGMSEGETDMAKRERERVQIGTDTNGKPIYTWVEGKNRQDFLINAAKMLLSRGMLEDPAAIPRQETPKTPYFKQYTEQWWKLYKLPKLRHTTRTTYRNLLDNHILPYFGKMRLEEIGTNTIQTFYNENGCKAKSTVRQMSILLHQIFDMAVEDGHMRMNPTESKRLAMPTKKKKREALAASDVKDILANLDKLEGQERLLIGLLLLTGMRRGEALGLCWENIDWGKKLICVEQAVTFFNNQPVVGETKSDAGNCVIPLDKQLEEVLTPMKKEKGFVIGDGEKPLTERTFTRMWERIGRKIDLHGATPHIFRHTYITLAASSGIDVKTLQSIAGHADIKMTMDRYAHKREEKVMEAGQMIGSVFQAV